MTTTDGFNIAFYAIGNGPPLVWMPMLPAEWEIVEQRRGYEAIAQISTFSRTCSLAPQGLEPVEQWISERKALWERRLDRLSDALERATARKDGRD